jgi:dihydroxyacetone kinase
MAGCSVTLVRLDDELISRLEMPVEVANRIF